MAGFRGLPGPILVSVEDGARVVLPDGFKDQTAGIAFSPDDRFAVAAGGQFIPEENVAKIWDLETLELIAEFDTEEKLFHSAVGFTADNEVLVGSYEALYRTHTDPEEEAMRVKITIGGDNDDALNVTAGFADEEENPKFQMRIDAEGEVYIEGESIIINGRAGLDLTSKGQVTINGRQVLAQKDPV